MKIRVPATSANLGPGFDSCGIALNLYMYVEIKEETDIWIVEHELGDNVARDEENLMISTALKIAPDIKPHKVHMISEIPIIRGLGSSSTAIVAGIEMADILAGLNLSKEEKVGIATEIEGHPDNVAPAILGDFITGAYFDGEFNYKKVNFPDTAIIAYIPEEPLSTERARSVLPKELAYKDAVKSSAISNVMVAGVISGDLRLAGRMMEKDCLHEPYRASLVPHLSDVRDIGHRYGAYATYLSGAGSTIIMLLDEESVDDVVIELKDLPYKAKVLELEIDRDGVIT
ncbi:MAG: homoserine kinase [Clostridioides sp.]|jgi:homoserine kinase|nr:homoserine kinase [Clostridioides sp.]